MKKWIVLLVIGALMLPIWIQARIRQEIVPSLAQQIAGMIQTAVQNYRDNHVSEGAILLCDVILMTRPRESWPEGFTGAVEEARGSFQEADFSRGVRHAKRAIRIFKPDYSVSSEEGGTSMAAIAQLISNNLESAIENFKSGNPDLSVVLILESLVLLSPAD